MENTPIGQPSQDALWLVKETHDEINLNSCILRSNIFDILWLDSDMHDEINYIIKMLAPLTSQ